MEDEDIEKSQELINDISKLNKIRQIEIAEDIDELLEDWNEFIETEEAK